MNKINKVFRTLAVMATLATLPILFTGCGKMRIARHESRADKYFAAGDLSKAEVEYLNVRMLSPTNSHAIARLGEIYYDQGRIGVSAAFINKACEYYTNDWDLRIKLGTIYLTMQRFKDARDTAALVLTNSPTNTEAPVLMAEAAISPAEIDQVRQKIEALSKQIGDTAAIELSYGVLDIRAGDLKKAEADLLRATTLDPKLSPAYFALGNLYAAQGKQKEAGENLKKASDFAEVRSPRRLGYADYKIANGDIPGAKQLLDDISKAAPDYVPAWIKRAQIALMETNYDESSTLVAQALARDPDNYDGSLMRGRLFMVQGHVDKATAEFERMASRYDRSPQVQYHLALTYLMSGDVSKGIASLNQALAIDPNYTDAIVTLAELNLRRGNVDVAVTALSQLAEKQPQMTQVQFLLADAYITQKNPDKALTIYTRLQQQYPKNAQIPLLIGRVLALENRLTDARKSFEKALELSPNLPNAIEQLVNLDIVENKYSEALALANAEAARDTNAVGPQLVLAQIYVARAMDAAKKAGTDSNPAKLSNVPAAKPDVDGAEAALLKAVKLNPNISEPYMMLAGLYAAVGKDQAALKQLGDVVARTNNIAAFMEIGRIQDTQSNYPAARDAYEKVLALNPNVSSALNNLAYLYSERLNDLDKAYALAGKARQLLPNDPSTADTLGWVLYRRGDYTRALGMLSESANKLPGEPEVQFHLGMTHYMLGQEDAAEATLGSVTTSSRDFPGKREAARRLAILAIDVKTADAKAVADLETSLRNDPSDPVAANRLAAIYERDGALDKAASTCEQVLKENSQNPRIMGRLAEIYLRLNDVPKGLDMAKQAHTLAPENGGISLTLGRLVFRSGDYTWALNLLQDAVGKLPGRSDALYDLAWSYYSVGKVADAETSMRNAVPALSGAMAEDAKTFLTLVTATKTAGEIEAAVPQATQVTKTNSNYVPAIMVLAMQAEQKGKYDDAQALYLKAIGVYPGFPPAARSLAILDASHPGDDQKALDAGMKARAAYPGDDSLVGALGIIAYRRADYARSADFLKGLGDKVNKDGELLYYLGMANYQLKQKQASKDALQHALNLNLRPDLAAEARKALAELK